MRWSLALWTAQPKSGKIAEYQYIDFSIAIITVMLRNLKVTIIFEYMRLRFEYYIQRKLMSDYLSIIRRYKLIK